MITDKLVRHAVQSIGGHAGSDVLGGFHDGIGRDTPSLADFFNRFLALNIGGRDPFRSVMKHIFRAVNVGGHG